MLQPSITVGLKVCIHSPTMVKITFQKVKVSSQSRSNVTDSSRRYSHNPKIFFHSAIDLSNRVFGSVSLPSLQSILLVVVHSLINPGGCDVWTLTHIAMAHAVDLGIHLEASTSGLFSSTAIELRRRVFFCVYSLDR